MSALIVPLDIKHMKEVREIFFESSTRKEFKDEAEREAFFYKYVGYYLKHYPQLCFVAVKDRVLGYIVGSPQSTEAELVSIQPHLNIFSREYQEYPAHLHINCHHESRGMGVGSLLVGKLIECLKLNNINGLHIMTGANAHNQSFYKKLGFDYEVVEDFRGSPILFMGKKLS